MKKGKMKKNFASDTGVSQPTKVKKANKDRDFKPAWKRILCGL